MEQTETKQLVEKKESKIVEKTKQALINAFDENGNGEIDVEDLIIKSLKIPGIKIDRDGFLRTEFKEKCSEEVVNAAVLTNPIEAGVPLKTIDKTAEDVIQKERIVVSGIATALSIPGSFAMLATIPADVAQYYGCMLRTAQKLMYLYGFPQIDVGSDEGVFDSETINMLTLCLGVMYGVAGADKAIKAIAGALSKGVPKQLVKRALTKGTVYPIVKSTSKWFGVKMTKEVFANFFKKSIPVAGVVLSGGITYLTFKPCCEKLKKQLRDTKLVNPKAEDTFDIIGEDSEL